MNEDKNWSLVLSKESSLGTIQDIQNPATSKSIGSYNSVDPKVINKAVIKAQQAFIKWDRKRRQGTCRYSRKKPLTYMKKKPF